MEIEALVRKQRDWFALGKTRSISFRIGALQTLKKEILGSRAEIEAALAADLGKSAFETYMCEIGMVLSELHFMIRHVRSLCKGRQGADTACTVPCEELYVCRAVWGSACDGAVELSVHARVRAGDRCDCGRQLCGRKAERLCAGDLCCDCRVASTLLFPAFCCGSRGRTSGEYEAAGAEV